MSNVLVTGYTNVIHYPHQQLAGVHCWTVCVPYQKGVCHSLHLRSQAGWRALKNQVYQMVLLPGVLNMYDSLVRTYVRSQESGSVTTRQINTIT